MIISLRHVREKQRLQKCRGNSMVFPKQIRNLVKKYQISNVVFETVF